jgi:hypothetical protein
MGPRRKVLMFEAIINSYRRHFACIDIGLVYGIFAHLFVKINSFQLSIK